MCSLLIDVDKENQDVAQDDQSPQQKKRRILVLDSEDSEDEYKPSKWCKIEYGGLYFIDMMILALSSGLLILPDKEDLEVLSESASSGTDSDEVLANDSVEESEDATPQKVDVIMKQTMEVFIYRNRGKILWTFDIFPGKH